MEPSRTARNVVSPPAAAGNLRAVPLHWDHCQELALKLPSSEKMECLANGYTIEQALAAGLLFGMSWAVLRGGPTVNLEDPVGAFGYTNQGAIWSLWGPLTFPEQRDILRMSRFWIPHLVELSGRPVLRNAVHQDNTKARAWLEATRCIGFDTCNPVANRDGTQSWAFETVPLKDPDEHV